jgi:hypothetical protein
MHVRPAVQLLCYSVMTLGPDRLLMYCVSTPYPYLLPATRGWVGCGSLCNDLLLRNHCASNCASGIYHRLV